jgi:hypothetical protein
MSQTAVITVNVVAVAPRLGQGDRDSSPTPEPRATRITVKEAAANAPPMIAAHATLELGASTVAPATPAL